MTDNFKTGILGSTGLHVGRLGLAASYGAPARAFEAAFEKGCNYFYIGSGRRRAGMKAAIRNLVNQGKREKMVIAVQTYARFGILTEFWFKRSLAQLGIEYADILILGWHNRMPPDMLVDFTLKMKEKGACRYIGMSGHDRSLFPRMAEKDIFDLFHIRYNPAHRGAETECFPMLNQADGPGVVTYTATRWGQLLNPKYMPKGQPALLASDCYRFSMSNPDVDVCLCGPKDMQQMETALTALEQGPLSPSEMDRVKAIGDHVHKNSKGFLTL